MTTCYTCQKPIIFSNNHVSANGKHIPLDATNMQPHQCVAKAARCCKCGLSTIQRKDQIKEPSQILGCISLKEQARYEVKFVAHLDSHYYQANKKDKRLPYQRIRK
jgi:hypothetical protein